MFYFSKNMPEGNNCPIGEISPYLVTRELALIVHALKHVAVVYAEQLHTPAQHARETKRNPIR
jgi:hypothetical protein